MSTIHSQIRLLDVRTMNRIMVAQTDFLHSYNMYENRHHIYDILKIPSKFRTTYLNQCSFRKNDLLVLFDKNVITTASTCKAQHTSIE